MTQEEMKRVFDSAYDLGNKHGIDRGISKLESRICEIILTKQKEKHLTPEQGLLIHLVVREAAEILMSEFSDL